MRLSLVIVTYQRPFAICSLLDSIIIQIHKPDEVIIIDASKDSSTEQILNDKNYPLQIKYKRVEDQYRGSALQRNYGLSLVAMDIEIVAFLDDDLKLEPDYFGNLLDTYKIHPDAIGVGGIDLKNNGYFIKQDGVYYNKFNYYELDGWVISESLRNKTRKIFRLMSDLQPDLIPEYSNGRSTFPPNGKIYQVEHFMGGIASFKKQLFDHIKFSNQFEGYGLYEDFDLCVRALPYGKLYVNTNAKVWHFHEPSGRPNFFKYGNMVVRNGWYVWRVRYPNPSVKSSFKWYIIALLLTNIRLLNVITGPDRKGALKEFCGRSIGLIQLIFNKPVIEL